MRPDQGVHQQGLREPDAREWPEPDAPEPAWDSQRTDIFQAVVKSKANNEQRQSPGDLPKSMDMVCKVTGRNSKSFEHGAEDAVRVVVMGGPPGPGGVGRLPPEERREGRRHRGPPVPPVEREALPRCAPEGRHEDRCLDQMNEWGSFGEPFFLDVASSLLDAQVPVVCVCLRYGLARSSLRRWL